MLREVPLSVSFYMFLLEVNRYLGHKNQLGMWTKDSQSAEKKLSIVEAVLGGKPLGIFFLFLEENCKTS